MKTLAAIILPIALFGSVAAHAESMQVTTTESRQSNPGSAEFFSGDVAVTPMFSPDNHTATSGGHVEFSPNARSAWHTHPAGQTLIVTDGTGWVQEEGGAKREIRPGDVIWTPAGVKHWHGATNTSSVSHIAVTENVDGGNVTWMEKVSDEDYLR